MKQTKGTIYKMADKPWWCGPKIYPWFQLGHVLPTPDIDSLTQSC